MAVKTIGEGYYSVSAKNVSAEPDTYKRAAEVFKTIRSERPTPAVTRQPADRAK